jgi:hypothetical protein
MRSTGTLALAHLLVNALLLWLGYYWLGIGESRTSTLAWSGFVALLTICLASSAYGAAFVYFQQGDRRTVAAWRTALRNLLPFLVGVGAVTVVYFLLAQWDQYSSKPALQVASYLTLTFRKPVRPSSIAKIFGTILWVIQWVILPVLLLPMFAAVASSGWSGFRAVGAFARRWLYWIEAPVLLVCALWIPMKILGWVPHVSSFGMEMASFTTRALVAYLLFVVAWLVLAFVTSAGKPRFTQSNTAPSP